MGRTDINRQSKCRQITRKLTEKRNKQTAETDGQTEIFIGMVNKAILIDRCSTILILMMAILIDLIRRYQLKMLNYIYNETKKLTTDGVKNLKKFKKIF